MAEGRQDEIGGVGQAGVGGMGENSEGGPEGGGGLIGGSAPVVSVDTFEDIKAAEMATTVREGGGYAGMREYGRMKEYANDFRPTWKTGLHPSAPGSVNLAPRGINVGYRGKSAGGGITSFDQLDESTKAAVKAAAIQSQSEDETENAIAQIYSAFQNTLDQANKNTMNRSEGSGSNTEPGDK